MGHLCLYVTNWVNITFRNSKMCDKFWDLTGPNFQISSKRSQVGRCPTLSTLSIYTKTYTLSNTMTALTIDNKGNTSLPSKQGIKRATSCPNQKSLLQTSTVVVSSDGQGRSCRSLQSSNPKRRYMRRGSKCPSMLRSSFTLPVDLHSLNEIDPVTRWNPPGPPHHQDNPRSPGCMITNEPYLCISENSTKRSAVDLLNEALHLSSNFEGLDIRTSGR